RVPPGASYVTDLLPGFLLVGIAIGLCAPSAQIGALTGVAEGSVGLASGLVETMREIGGAVGIAVVSTVLVARTRDAIELASPAARQVAAFEGFQTAFAVIAAVAALGIVIAALAFPRSSGRLRAPAMEEPEVSPEPEVVLDAAVVDPA
ncbi:MAG TPA: hypothetical protein VGJ99_07105, partial [Actinomycetota bacterium]